MEYADEKIQAFLNEAEKAKMPNDICSGPVRVGKRYYEFEESAFFDDKLYVYIPKDFTEMPDHLRKLKYPYEQRPEIIQIDVPLPGSNPNNQTVTHMFYADLLPLIYSGSRS